MKKIIKVFCLFYALYFTLCTFSFAEAEKEGFMKRMWRRITSKTESVVEEEKKEEKKEGMERAPVRGRIGPQPVPKLTKEQMIEITNNNLSIYGEEISLKIPELVKGRRKGAGEVYLFKKASGEKINFEDLDEDTLFKLYVRVINEANIIWAERLNEQLKNLRQIRMQQPSQVPQPPRPVTIPSTPSTYKAPGTPTIKYSIPEVPKVPKFEVEKGK